LAIKTGTFKTGTKNEIWTTGFLAVPLLIVPVLNKINLGGTIERINFNK